MAADWDWAPAVRNNGAAAVCRALGALLPAADCSRSPPALSTRLQDCYLGSSMQLRLPIVLVLNDLDIPAETLQALPLRGKGAPAMTLARVRRQG